MRALQLTAWGQPAEIREIDTPEPGPGEVLLKVAGSGACHSDLHLMEWPEGTLQWELPFTLGHETTGWIDTVGAGVTGLEAGDLVAVYGPWGCGQCRRCRLGMENYCERATEIPYAGGGLGRDGGMAEYMLVPSARHLVPLGDLDPVQAAPLTDAGLTPYHAVKRSLSLLVPGTCAVVIGVGGLGHMGLQILRALTPSRLIAVDTSDDKLQLAEGVGADVGVLAGTNAADEIRTATGGKGAEVVIDMVGSDDTLAIGSQVVRTYGHLTIVGIAGGTLPVSFFGTPYECSVATTYWGSVTELTEVIELAATGSIQAHIEQFPLDDATTAYELMRKGNLKGRSVIVP